MDFAINDQLIKTLGLILPFRGIDQAEYALMTSAISITSFKEMDSTNHDVLIFDPRPIGYSGFMNCVKHSMLLSNNGLFEVGRYAAMSLTSESRYWQWFIHRRLASVTDVNTWIDDRGITTVQLMQDLYQSIIAQ